MKPAHLLASLPRLRHALSVLLLLAFCAPAHAWWSHDWSYRKQINLDLQQASLNGDVDNAVVLVRLHEGVFKFSDANPDGSDLRFVDGDDKTPLHYHVERFDSVFNLAFVWVQVPALKAGKPASIWLYYGNAKATAENGAADTYDPEQLLVYHFGEKGKPPVDSSAFKHNATTAVLPDDSALIAGGARFDGKSVVALPESPSLNLAAGQNATFTMWVKPAAAADAVLLSKRDVQGNALVIGTAAGIPYVALEVGRSPAGRAMAAASIADGAWHHLAVVAAPQLTLYVDGQARASLATPLPAIAAAAVLGADGGNAGAALRAGFVGEIDELAIAKAARPPAMLQLLAGNQGVEDKLVSFGADEAQSSWSTGYFGIILRSVTLDAWVVIGVLFVLAVISWIVMITKTRLTGRIRQSNDLFLEQFGLIRGDIINFEGARSLGDEQRGELEVSGLYRMYQVGRAGVLHRFESNGPGALSAESIEAIRASIDAAQVRENQRLSKGLVALTIAISGGPFIGLLGTVVGVMITFASIAAAGDVNVNAIAPGISAALLATVAGMAVAIPALFGYNFLLGRIKDIQANMSVFVDEFVTLMAELYPASGYGHNIKAAVGHR